MSVSIKQVGKKLVIECDIPDVLEPSCSGKSLIVASTNGNLKTDVLVKGKNVVVGLNAYIPNK